MLHGMTAMSVCPHSDVAWIVRVHCIWRVLCGDGYLESD